MANLVSTTNIITFFVACLATYAFPPLPLTLRCDSWWNHSSHYHHSYHHSCGHPGVHISEKDVSIIFVVVVVFNWKFENNYSVSDIVLPATDKNITQIMLTILQLHCQKGHKQWEKVTKYYVSLCTYVGYQSGDDMQSSKMYS